MGGELTVDDPPESPSAAHQRLSEIFDAHHRRLYLLARRLSSSADEAKDLVQETFLRAAGSWKAVPEGAEEAWLVRVLINLCRDRWKQAATRARLAHYVGSADAGASSHDAESALVAQRVVWQAMATLPPRRRAVVVLHELEGASVPEVAKLLGITTVTVRWHLSKGRRELRQFLLEAGATT